MENKDRKIADIAAREYAEGYPVELWRDINGRLVIRARNEGGHSVTHVDLFDILEWAKTQKFGLPQISAEAQAEYRADPNNAWLHSPEKRRDRPR